MAKYDREYKELEDKYNQLLAEFEQYKKESIKWSIEDFTENENGVEIPDRDDEDFEEPEYLITEEQAQQALYDMINNYDTEYGIDWSAVQYYKELYGTKNPNYES